MGSQKLALLLISQLITAPLIYAEPHASEIDLTKLRCVRQDRQEDKIYLSEIHFKKEGAVFNVKRGITDPDQVIQGEVLSYAITGQTKQFISGYSLFSISFKDEVISGLTGDQYTRTDGSFTLTRQNQKNNGTWRFSYTGIAKETITADFKCVYRPNGYN